MTRTCQAYPPGPTWIIQGAAASEHHYVYCSRNIVVVLDPITMQLQHTFIASTKKLSAIALHGDMCATAGEDSVVRIWSLSSFKLVKSFMLHNKPVTVVQWLPQGTAVVSGDASGRIAVHSMKGDSKASSKVNSEVCAIAPLRRQDINYVAIGYMSGEIMIEHIDDDLSLIRMYQLPGEVAEGQIYSLSWQHLTVYDDPDTWPLLASTAKNQSDAVIWTVETESRFCILRRPRPSGYCPPGQRTSDQSLVSWSKEITNHIYYATHQGSVSCYSVNYAERRSKLHDRLAEKHSRVIFTMTWLYDGRSLVTTSMDNNIIKWNMETRNSQTIIRTHQAFGYSIDISAQNLGRAAVGLGRGNIRIWHYSKEDVVMADTSQDDFYASELFWKGQGIKPNHHVTQVTWHPNKRGILAFTTSNDCVGTFNTVDQKSASFKTHHKEGSECMVVWSMDLSRVLEEPDWIDTLISCGNGNELFVFNAANPRQPPIDLNERLEGANEKWYACLKAKEVASLDLQTNAKTAKKTSRCCLGVDDAYRYLALGSTDGYVEVYSLDNLKLVYHSQLHRSSIKAMQWHRQGDNLWLATGCEGSTIIVHDLGHLETTRHENIEKQETGLPAEIPMPNQTAFRCLKGHTDGITDIRWSHHENQSFLASASEDNRVFVWDVQQGVPVSLFRQHLDAVLSVCWDVSRPDIVFSTSKDQFLYMWNMKDYLFSKHEASLPSLADEQKKNLKTTKKRNGASSDTSGNNAKKQKTAMASITAAAAVKEEDRNELRRQCYLRVAVIWKKEPTAAWHYVKNKLEGTRDARVESYTKLSDTEQVKGKTAGQELVFCPKQDILRAVDAGEFDDGLTPFIANPTALGALASFSSTTSLTSWITLALSPTAGKTEWLERMEEQARKLMLSNEYDLAVACYLSCSKIHAAVDVYRRAAMFKQAILVAKLRLSSSDPVIPKLFTEWAAQLQAFGQDELSTLCILQTSAEGSLVNAINMLARSNEEDALFWSACIAQLTGDDTTNVRIQHWKDKVLGRLADTST